MSILADRIRGAVAADLFAGSGALGLELLSRGAAHVTFVERSRRAAGVIDRNLRALGAVHRATVIKGDANAHVRTLGRWRYDLALADPPYDHGYANHLFAAYGRTPFARELWVEYRTGEIVPDEALAETRRYGDTVLGRATVCEPR